MEKCFYPELMMQAGEEIGGYNINMIGKMHDHIFMAFNKENKR